MLAVSVAETLKVARSPTVMVMVESLAESEST